MDAAKAMTRDVICIRPEDPLDDAWSVMSKLRIRHLPVLAGDRLVGILSDRDVLVRSQLGDGTLFVPSIPVAEAMTPAPICCAPGARIADVADAMLDNKIDSIPVMDENEQLVGLITSSDLIALARRSDPVWRETLVPFEFNVKRGRARDLANELPAQGLS